jgi:hypothetical protein
MVVRLVQSNRLYMARSLLPSLVWGVTNVAGRGREITIDGIVEKDSLDAILLSHRLSIVGVDGHVYEVEPNYIGAYLQRFEGHRVIARAELVFKGQGRSVIRISSLRLMGEAATDVSGGIAGNMHPLRVDAPDEGPGEVDETGIEP